mmetsp:Transcript_11874/g.27321  ORF Transcript_11874/g.27321 Transcript_11874/m.27321 type:complete len:218 (-) Transcript_11874:115-768(-)
MPNLQLNCEPCENTPRTVTRVPPAEGPRDGMSESMVSVGRNSKACDESKKSTPLEDTYTDALAGGWGGVTQVRDRCDTNRPATGRALPNLHCSGLASGMPSPAKMTTVPPDSGPSGGDNEVIVRSGTYANCAGGCSATSAISSETSAGACGGVEHCRTEAEWYTVNARAPAIEHWDVGTKLEPVTTTAVCPEAEPDVGRMDVITGAGTYVNRRPCLV